MLAAHHTNHNHIDYMNLMRFDASVSLDAKASVVPSRMMNEMTLSNSVVEKLDFNRFLLAWQQVFEMDCMNFHADPAIVEVLWIEKHTVVKLILCFVVTEFAL